MPCPIPGPEEAALLQAIKDSDPVDNAIRRVYADFLLDQGREEQADFVRYQKDHDDPFSAHHDPGLDTPEGRAAGDYAERTLREWVGRGPYIEDEDYVNVQFRRGLLHAVMPAETFLSGRYGTGLDACRRAGWVETIELLNVTDVHIRRLPYAMARPSERLALRGTEITPDGLALLAGLPRVQSVDLEKSWGIEPAELFARLKLVPCLRRLAWSGPLSESALAPLDNHGDLRCLCLDLGDVLDDWLAPVFTLTGLCHLSLVGGRALTDEFLSGLKSLVNLRFLSFTGTGTFSSAALDQLRHALPQCAIQTAPDRFGQHLYPLPSGTPDDAIPF